MFIRPHFTRQKLNFVLSEVNRSKIASEIILSSFNFNKLSKVYKMTGNTIDASASDTSVVNLEVSVKTPNWLTVEFIERQLQNYYKNSELKIIKFEVNTASENGIGFCSSMYRVKVSFNMSLKNKITSINQVSIIYSENVFN